MRVVVALAGGFLALIILASIFGGEPKKQTASAKKGPDCGSTMKNYAGSNGLKADGTQYTDLPGEPVVMDSRGSGVSCSNLIPLAKAVSDLKGVPLVSWVEKNGWKWISNSDDAKFALCKPDDYEVFVGAGKGKNSQVCFYWASLK